MIELQRSEYFAFTKPLAADGALSIGFAKGFRGFRGFWRKDVTRMIANLQPYMPVAMPLVDGPADITFRFSRKLRTMGVAVSPGFRGNAGWDLVVRRGLPRPLARWVLLHELGHALGLEHPFNASDGDNWPGATVRDTAMAYEMGGRLPKFRFRRADIDAITGLWAGWQQPTA